MACRRSSGGSFRLNSTRGFSSRVRASRLAAAWTDEWLLREGPSDFGILRVVISRARYKHRSGQADPSVPRTSREVVPGHPRLGADRFHDVRKGDVDRPVQSPVLKQPLDGGAADDDAATELVDARDQHLIGVRRLDLGRVEHLHRFESGQHPLQFPDGAGAVAGDQSGGRIGQLQVATGRELPDQFQSRYRGRVPRSRPPCR